MALSWDPQEHYKKAEIAESYDRERFTSLAGRVFNSLEKRALLRALHSIPVGSEILDIPCGTGRLAEALLEAGYHVTGIDVSAAMLIQANRKLARFGNSFTSRVGDAFELPAPERPFAAVVCARILMHFPLARQIEFLHGITAQTDGLVVFNQSYDSAYHRARRRFKRLLTHAIPTAFPLDEAAIQHLLRGAGLRELHRIYLAPPISEAFFLAATRR